MTTLLPRQARQLWLAILENASRLLVEAGVLTPSPRAQALVILAQEEIGKAAWISTRAMSEWLEGSEQPLDFTEVASHFKHHHSKLAEVTYWAEGADEFVSTLRFDSGGRPLTPVALVHGIDPASYPAYLSEQARDANLVKQRSFYVDFGANDEIHVPGDCEAESLEEQIIATALLVHGALTDERVLSSLGNARALPQGDELASRIHALINPIIQQGA